MQSTKMSPQAKNQTSQTIKEADNHNKQCHTTGWSNKQAKI